MTKYIMILAMMMMIGCGEDDTKKTPPMGSEGGSCYENGTCDGDLVCLLNMCIDAIETPDKDTATTDNSQPDETGDTEQPDVDWDPGTPGDMVDVPAGEFWMGCHEAVDDQCYEDEYPFHAVTLIIPNKNPHKILTQPTLS